MIWSQEKRKECLETLLDYINKNLNTNGIKLWMELYESRKKYPNLIGTEQYFMEIFVDGEYMVLSFRSGILSRYSGEWEDVLVDHFLQNPKSKVFVNMEMRLSNLEKLGI